MEGGQTQEEASLPSLTHTRSGGVGGIVGGVGVGWGGGVRGDNGRWAGAEGGRTAVG